MRAPKQSNKMPLKSESSRTHKHTHTHTELHCQLTYFWIYGTQPSTKISYVDVDGRQNDVVILFIMLIIYHCRCKRFSLLFVRMQNDKTTVILM